MTTLALIGPGAIGGTLATWLAQRGDLDLTVCVRTPFERLVLETPDGEVTATPRLVTSPEILEERGLAPVDWVLVATKAYDDATAAPWLKTLVGPDTRVAVIRNGVEHREAFAGRVADENLVPVIVDFPAERPGPGVFRQRRYGWIRVPEGAAGEAFVALFEGCPIDVATTDDFVSVAWRKLALNAAGAVNAMTLKPSGVAHDPGAAAVMKTLVAECVAVGRAEGATLSDDIGEQVVEGYRAGPPDMVNSLLADRAAGRPMELDARNGVIVRRGEKHGIATPANAMIVALLNAAAG
ncbi:2-dehydropantoate 2-reductase [Caulobacter sp. RL271]|uniref:2-dehydropantoate 2-reductase n=1 Tax=Caulobacter segnis TaxID=88688 RepID=A0ABY4ZTG0_9CAUL|nr:2-dehydropantoate 2-reductase [Caulobacter segnis]USQ95664.1 2-dehydropantoate 2-reductase [Caulobacter segnis]